MDRRLGRPKAHGREPDYRCSAGPVQGSRRHRHRRAASGAAKGHSGGAGTPAPAQPHQPPCRWDRHRECSARAGPWASARPRCAGAGAVSAGSAAICRQGSTRSPGAIRPLPVSGRRSLITQHPSPWPPGLERKRPGGRAGSGGLTFRVGSQTAQLASEGSLVPASSAPSPACPIASASESACSRASTAGGGAALRRYSTR